MILVGLTEGTQGMVTEEHWLCRQFSSIVRVNPPQSQHEIFELVQKVASDIKPESPLLLTESEAGMLMRAAQWNIRTLRGWTHRSIAMNQSTVPLEYVQIMRAVEDDVEYLLSRIEYCALRVPLERYRAWAKQFPSDLASIPFDIVRKVKEKYYISATEFQSGIRNLIKVSGIKPGENVSFCRWQPLGRSGPMVANELKNRGNWKLTNELDLQGIPRKWPRIGNGDGVTFVLADDFVGSGRSLDSLFRKGKIQELIRRYPASGVKILLVAGYEDPIMAIRQAARKSSDRIALHVHRLFDNRDRCFTEESRIFESDRERKRIMDFCLDVAKQHFPPLPKIKSLRCWRRCFTLHISPHCSQHLADIMV